MMSQPLPEFSECAAKASELAEALGIDTESLSVDLPPEIVATSTRHLFIPVCSLKAIQTMKPDFSQIEALSRSLDVLTVDTLSLETIDPECVVHSRDFCPIVGTPEAAASGTTNSALSCYLVKHGMPSSDQTVPRLMAEQGFEMGRPSRIHTEVTVSNGAILGVRVGGKATLSLEGRVRLAD